jgi:uncharacterized damage-inducible protein DinB
MRINERIVDTLERAFKANAWHGPALLESLEDVDRDTAIARPIDKTHSIWELVIHLTVWKDVVRQRLISPAPILPTDEEDWPKLPEATSANWTSMLESLHRAHGRLIEDIRALPVDAFDKIVPGKDYNAFVMLLGVAQHDNYHAGQITLLKKATHNRK